MVKNIKIKEKQSKSSMKNLSNFVTRYKSVFGKCTIAPILQESIQNLGTPFKDQEQKKTVSVGFQRQKKRTLQANNSWNLIVFLFLCFAQQIKQNFSIRSLVNVTNPEQVTYPLQSRCIA